MRGTETEQRRMCDCPVEPFTPAAAFIPGRTDAGARPDERAILQRVLPRDGAFKCVRQPRCCKALQLAATWLVEGFRWESHVVLEALWHRARNHDARLADLLQGLIHLAAAKLKNEVGKPGGAVQQQSKALAKLRRGDWSPREVQELIDCPRLVELLQDLSQG